MNIIIVLSGKEKVGKTTTLTKVYKALIDNENQSHEIRRDNLDGDPLDFKAEIEYNGIRVGINTQGDYTRNITDDLPALASDCDIVVCACQNKLTRLLPKTSNVVVYQQDSIADEQTNIKKILTDVKGYKKQTLKEILSDLLKRQKENPGKDIDELIKEALSDYGAGKEDIELYEEASSCLEGFNAKYNDLRAAKEEGTSRGSWLSSQLEQAASKLPENQREKFLSEISKGVKSANSNLIKED